MNLLRMAALTLLLLSSTWIWAVDPGVHVKQFTGPGTPVGLSFTFTSDASGGGSFNFTNASGVTFTFLEINVAKPIGPGPMAGPITCGGNAFSNCFLQYFTEGGFGTVDFFGGPGILNGNSFQVDLGVTGWMPNGVFTAFANETDEPEPLPEPGMLILFGTGLGALLLRSKSSVRIIADRVTKITDAVW